MDAISTRREPDRSGSQEPWLAGEDPFAPSAHAVNLGELVRLLALNYHRFVPGVAALLLSTTVGTTAQSFVVGAALSPLLFAGAARTLGYLSTPVLESAVERGATHLLNLAALTAIGAAAASPGLIFTAILFREHPTVPVGLLGLSLLVLSGLPIAAVFLRLWTILTIAFTCVPPEMKALFGRIRLGPGLLSAWRMTRNPEAAGDHTIPLAKYSLLLFGCLAAAHVLLGWLDPFAALLRVVLHGFVLPLWSLLAIQLGGRLHSVWREDKAVGEADLEDLVAAAVRQGCPSSRASAHEGADERHPGEADPHSQREAGVVELRETERPSPTDRGCL